MDRRLRDDLAKTHTSVNVKDKDRLFAVDGAEGRGKSVLTFQLCSVLDPSFDISRVCFTPKEFELAIRKASKGQAVVFDEAFTGLSSRAALSKINRLLVSLMMEFRQKNLFVFIVLPTIFLLDKYVALWRSVGLFHVYTKRGRRGQWVYFNRRKKKALYLYGKKDYTYTGKHIPMSSFKGRFLDQYTVDEKLYRKKKRAALESKAFGIEVDEYLIQRDRLLWYMSEVFGMSGRKLSVGIKGFGVKLHANSILEGIKRAKDGFIKDE